MNLEKHFTMIIVFGTFTLLAIYPTSTQAGVALISACALCGFEKWLSGKREAHSVSVNEQLEALKSRLETMELRKSLGR